MQEVIKASQNFLRSLAMIIAGLCLFYNVSADDLSSVEEIIDFQPKVRAAYFAHVFGASMFADIGDDVVYGVSDYQLDTLIAKEQALFRAISMAKVQRGCEIQNKGVFFTVNGASGEKLLKRNVISLISSQGQSYAIELLNIYRTSWEETIVVARIADTTESDIVVSGSYFYNRVEKNSTIHESHRVEMFANQSTQKTDSLVYYLDDKAFSYFSEFNTLVTQEIPCLRKYIQKSEIKLDRISLLTSGFSEASLLHGLWPAYLSCFYQQLSSLAKQKEMKIQVLKDSYGDATWDLCDDVTCECLSTTLDSIVVYNNSLYLRLKDVK